MKGQFFLFNIEVYGEFFSGITSTEKKCLYFEVFPLPPLPPSCYLFLEFMVGRFLCPTFALFIKWILCSRFYTMNVPNQYFALFI